LSYQHQSCSHIAHDTVLACTYLRSKGPSSRSQGYQVSYSSEFVVQYDSLDFLVHHAFRDCVAVYVCVPSLKWLVTYGTLNILNFTSRYFTSTLYYVIKSCVFL